ncbi:TonB-dependent receptor [Sphingobacterium kyonggiense]
MFTNLNKCLKATLSTTFYCFMILMSYGQTSSSDLSGEVLDAQGAKIASVTVSVLTQSNKRTSTDDKGRFVLKDVSLPNTLILTAVGYDTLRLEVLTASQALRAVLQEKKGDLEEVVVVGMGTQRKVSVVGAVTTVDPKQLQSPSTSVTNMLGGVVPGIISTTRSGEPGNDFSEFWIRGISTFGANSGALVLIDGVEGNLNDLDPSDISGFSILKDASSTAVYGVRGANGVVLVTTHKGEAGKMNITLKSNASLSYSPRMPEYLGAYDYAQLANEARQVRGLDPRYSDIELQIMKYGMDYDLYADVNWQEEILKKYTFNNQHYLNLSGGGKIARYFVSVGAIDKDAVFNQDLSANKYKTNVNWKKYNFRANIDANITPTTVLSLGLDGAIINQNAPGFGDNNNALWNAQANLTPVTVPIRYSNGSLPAYGINGNEISPYVLLNHTGFKNSNRGTTKINFSLAQDLNSITQGLKFHALYSYLTNNGHNMIRRKMPDLYKAYGRYNDGTLMIQRTVSEQSISFAKSTFYDRKHYFESRLNYDRSFGDHRIGGLVHYYMSDFQTSTADNEINSIPKRYQAISGRATYSLKDTYFLEANIGYTGSENFKPGEQFGWFPSIAAGWVPTQYKWVKENLSALNFFKIRGSYGQVGNDQISSRRFPYLTYVNFNNAGRWGANGLTEGQIGADNLRWEVAKKYNLGLDFQFFNNKAGLTVDIFKDLRDGIFQERQLMPVEVGVVNKPFVNVGKMRSQGFDGNAYYNFRINNDLKITTRANFTFAEGKVVHWDQDIPKYPYQSYSGVPLGINRGLISMGLFKDSVEIMSSPKQVFGEVLPGDIRYKDVNGDGVVNDDDIVPISFSNTPKFQYGLGASVEYKKFTLSFLFEGVSDVSYFYGGNGYYPFVGGEVGNILTIVNDPSNRWIPSWYSGDPSTENPNARFPRLTYGNSANNNRNSTFWQADGRYVRLKYVDLSYRLSSDQLNLKRFGVQNIILQLVGYNLGTWDRVKLWDPGQASSNGAVYPVQRMYTGQITITF